jgi:hypothetical protein
VNGLSDFDLMTLAEVAQLLHCSKAHIPRAVAGLVPGCPAIPAVSLGRRKLVRRATLLSCSSSTLSEAHFPQAIDSTRGDARRREILVTRRVEQNRVCACVFRSHVDMMVT